MPGRRFPDWMRREISCSLAAGETRSLVSGMGLNTVCLEARCPNLAECYGRRTATFMILGKICTRHCAFCAVTKGKPLPVDLDEPRRLAECARALGLKHVVVTSVTRDDLGDGGASQFAAVVRAIRDELPGATVELLIPDFKGDAGSLNAVLEEKPDVLNHNLETVSSLYKEVRPGAGYERSLTLLRSAAEAGIKTKSGMMLGLGETEEQVLLALGDLQRSGVQYLTLGQYLAPTPQHHPVREYVKPETFAFYRSRALDLGFKMVWSGPYIRSSYRAGDVFSPAQEPQEPGCTGLC